jgi:hypothetical protein
MFDWLINFTSIYDFLIGILHCFHNVVLLGFQRLLFLLGSFWCFSATFSNISAISWRPVLVVEEAGVPGENLRQWASNW